MIIRKPFCLLAFLLCLFVNVGISQTANKDFKLNVLSYKTNLEPDIDKKYIQGDVTISFLLDPHINEVVFNSGSLRITQVTGKPVTGYVQRDKKLIISLANRVANENQIQIFYNGKPGRGLVFPKPGQAHTVYFTSEWMVCNDAPNDKAKFEIDLLIPSGKTCIAIGVVAVRYIDVQVAQHLE